MRFWARSDQNVLCVAIIVILSINPANHAPEVKNGPTLAFNNLFMPQTFKKLEGHIAFRLSVCLSLCVCIR